jgi:hypothetical protein
MNNEYFEILKPRMSPQDLNTPFLSFTLCLNILWPELCHCHTLVMWPLVSDWHLPYMRYRVCTGVVCRCCRLGSLRSLPYWHLSMACLPHLPRLPSLHKSSLNRCAAPTTISLQHKTTWERSPPVPPLNAVLSYHPNDSWNCSTIWVIHRIGTPQLQGGTVGGHMNTTSYNWKCMGYGSEHTNLFHPLQDKACVRCWRFFNLPEKFPVHSVQVSVVESLNAREVGSLNGLVASGFWSRI